MSRSKIMLCVFVIAGWTVPAGVSRAEEAWCTTGAAGPSDPCSSPSDNVCWFGTCDNPVERDKWLSGGLAGDLVIKVKFNILTSDVGPEHVDWQEDQTDWDFEDYNIDFEYERAWLTGSQWYDTPILTCIDEQLMKGEHADDPAHKLNVYVIDDLLEPGGSGFLKASGTFPWETRATQTMGGIIVTEGAFGDKRVVSHEIGHCLGLWHTHHGVTEVPDLYE